MSKQFGDSDTTSGVKIAIGLLILLGFAVTLRLRQLVVPSASRRLELSLTPP